MASSSQPGDLSNSALLEMWERGAEWHPLDQALMIVGYAHLDGSSEDLSEWAICQRDRRLLEIRLDTFGDRIEAYAECPACRNVLEFELSCHSLLEQGKASELARKTVEYNGVQWELRAPNSRDLSAAVVEPDLQAARAALLTRCVRPANQGDLDSGPWQGVPEAALAEHLATLDPLAEILIDLTCLTCGHTWQSLFDIATFLWSEISAYSRRLLQDIDVLARTYGWTEGESLRLTNSRRRLYVQMALS
jgi:hypothetical protein